MEKLCNNIAEKIAYELNYDKNKKEVIAYGMFALLQMTLSILLVVLFGALFDVMLEALIISFTTSILRKYSGGVHASSSAACIILGTVICIGQAVVIKFLSNYGVTLNAVIISGVVIFVWSFGLIYKLAPVDSPSKPIVRQEKRSKMKKGSIIILSAYLFIVITTIIIYLYNGSNNLIKYCLCIYMGILWQVFTITTYGHLIIKKLELFFINILKLRGEKNEKIK